MEDFKKCISDFTDAKVGSFFFTGCVMYQENDILLNIIPNLFETRDKSGLVYLSEVFKFSDYLGQGAFRLRNTEIVFFCHSFFRRSLSRYNSFNTSFLDHFISLHKSENQINLKIALDIDLVGYFPSNTGMLEFDYCWGGNYNDDISKIPNGVTVYQSNEFEQIFSGVSETQFWWKKDDNERILEVEELRDTESLGVGKEKYGCRYVHSIFNNEIDRFRHFDGAIRLYNSDEMILRLDEPINRAGKNSNYTKIFRIDGQLDLHIWKQLVTEYYQNNPLLYEYFGIKKEYEELKNAGLLKIEKTPIENYVPHKLKEGKGLRLFISYHTPTPLKKKKFDRIIINPDCVGHKSGKKIEVIEIDTVELKKSLLRIGERLHIPKEYQFVSAEDKYINYPTILHSNTNTQVLLQNTLKAYLNLFEKFDLSVVITLTLAWQIEDMEVRVSLYGGLNDLIAWLRENKTIPIEHEKFRGWLDTQNIWLSKNYEYRDFPSSLIQDDGVFYMKRTPLIPKWLKDSGITVNNKPYYDLEIPKEHQDLYSLINDNEIHLVQSVLVKEAVCSQTGKDYLNSDVSQFFDDITPRISEYDIMGLYWTDK